MYFAAEPLNDRDLLLKAIPPADRRRVIMPLLPPVAGQDTGTRRVVFDIVLGVPGTGRAPT